MEKIEVERDLLEGLLDDVIELWNMANNKPGRHDEEIYEAEIYELEKLLGGARMHGMKIESGINNCHWNTEGKCTNWEITLNKRILAFTRDYDSKQNCTLTILGVHLCHGYKPETS